MNPILLSLLLLPFSTAQTSTLAQPPAGTPATSLDGYDAPYRPQIHFSPPQGFMNDPNGLFVDSTGVYHLYYQLDPTELVAGNQHWGHATSTDFYHWTNQPIALSPSAGDPSGLIFSGSAVTDPNNTSGLFPAGSLNATSGASAGVIAAYTLAHSDSQYQDIAYSFDNGYTFTNYTSNPVLNDNDNPNFRDPHVSWHAPTQRWVMAVAYAQLYIVAFYTSPNMIDWTPTSNFSTFGLLGLQWECPNLIEVPLVKDAYAPLDEKFASSNIDGTAWLLQISINPGAPQGGSISQFFPGDFNGTHFTPADSATRLTDWAKDNYAGQFFNNVDAKQPQVLITWASNWQYTNSLPTASSGFRSTMGIPRHIGLARNTPRSPWTLIQSPVPIPSSLYLPSLNTSSSPPNASSTTMSTPETSALPSFASAPMASTNLTLTNTSLSLPIPRSVLPSGAFVLILTASNLSFIHPQTGQINYTLSTSIPSSGNTSESLSGGFIFSGDGTGLAWLDRSNTHGYSGDPTYTSQFSTVYILDTESGRGMFEMMVFVDRSILEVFLDGGVGPSGTMVFFPEAEGGLDLLSVASQVGEGVAVQADVKGLSRSWAEGA